MATRRSLLATLTVLAAGGGSAGVNAQSTDPATSFIDTLLRKVTAIVNGSEPRKEKQAALANIVDNDVDVSQVARFCLGRFWRMATPAQQRDFVALFRRVLVNSVTEKVGEYQGVTYTVGQSLPRDGNYNVPTVLNRPGNAPNKVVWLVSVVNGAPKIVDVIAEGVSLRLTQRSDYASYLARNNNNVQALIDAIRQQASNQQS